MININNLHNEIDKRERRKKVVYREVFIKCCARVMTVNEKSNDCFCLFAVPTVIFGIPLYNMTDCIIYVMQELINRSFKVQYMHPNLLYINWIEKPKKTDSSISNNQFRLTDINSSPSIYHPTDLKTIEYRASSIFNDS
jgi:hypothetical protein